MRKRKVVDGFGYAATSNYKAPVWWMHDEYRNGPQRKTVGSADRHGGPFFPAVYPSWYSHWVYTKVEPYWASERKRNA